VQEKKRHIKRDCLDQKKNKDEENEGSTRFVNVMEDDSEAIDGDMLSLASNSGHPVDSWILDLACSVHVTSNRN
jgi:hypothetical protein